jgi:hypothetical protein
MKIIDLISEAQQKELVADIKEMIAKVAAVSSITRIVEDKDFFYTKEMKERGWSEAQINKFVDSGRLTRIEAGGKAGYKYPAIQVENLIKELYVVHTPHKKGKVN